MSAGIPLAGPEEAGRWCRGVVASPRTLGFVPTMGALHEGHLELVRASVAENDRTVASLFVNPLQFDDRADYERYPRDVEADARLLAGAGCDLALTGTLDEMFPEAGGREDAIGREDPGPAAVGLEGAHRPGHFDGVATIVRRLFELTRPAVAYFGEKDFQQTLVVGELARRLGFPRVRVVPTVREPSGLALSSRNARLSPAGREAALGISRGLFAARRAFREGVRDAAVLAGLVADEIRAAGLELEYAELRDAADWGGGPLVDLLGASGEGPVRHVRALAAARVEGVRLIDNLRLDGDA